MLEAIDHIESFLDGVTFESYQADVKTKSAVERQLQVMTEAAIRLGDHANTIAPGPDWEGFRGMGNLLRHAYHRIDDQIVWNTVKDDLPPMRAILLRALESETSGDSAPTEPSAS
ncbi:MAG TPA: DUF86 domain-containing protein [Gemmatimonadaceae bacterium]|jgi:uncharacterized protein with HEPN domain